MRLASVLRVGGALARRGGRRAAVRRGEAPPPAGGTARLAPRAAVPSANATAVAMFAAETAVAVWDASTRERCGRARAMSQLAHLFEGGRQPRGRARAVHGEGRRPSDGRLRRERAGADGQQCERDGTHRVLCLLAGDRAAELSRLGPPRVRIARGLQQCIRPIGTQGFCRGDISVGGLTGCTRRLAGDWRFIWSQRRPPATA